jgi:hypothetical protein
METVYQWEIMNLHPKKSLNGLSDVISAITYVYRGIREDDVQGFITGKLDLDSPNVESFIDYSGITQETIISWLESNVDVEEYKINIQNRIEDNLIQYTNQYDLPLPWATITTPNNTSI